MRYYWLIFEGMISGMASDPVFLVTTAISIGAGLLAPRFLIGLIYPILAVAGRAGLLALNGASMERLGPIFLVNLIACLFVYGCIVGIRQVLSMPKS